MNIQAHRAEYQDVEGLRGLCRQEIVLILLPNSAAAVL
jgi:hypothetical protein